MSTVTACLGLVLLLVGSSLVIGLDKTGLHCPSNTWQKVGKEFCVMEFPVHVHDKESYCRSFSETAVVIPGPNGEVCVLQVGIHRPARFYEEGPSGNGAGGLPPPPSPPPPGL